MLFIFYRVSVRPLSLPTDVPLHFYEEKVFSKERRSEWKFASSINIIISLYSQHVATHLCVAIPRRSLFRRFLESLNQEENAQTLEVIVRYNTIVLNIFGWKCISRGILSRQKGEEKERREHR